MTTTPENKDIHCLEIKQAVQEKIQQEIKGISPEEELAYYRRETSTGQLGEWWRRVKEAKPGRISDREVVRSM